MSNMKAPKHSPRKRPHSASVAAALAIAALLVQSGAQAGSREQAKRMYDRLTGTPPTPALLDDLTNRVDSDPVAAALYMLDASSARSNGFYSVTLKNFATPWTNRDQTVFAPLNDYTATVIGMVRDDKDFRGVLFDDILYVAPAVSPAYSPTSNAHYDALESNSVDLRSALAERAQSSLNGLPANATAGVITSRAAAEAFFIDGTNRAMFRFTLLNHLCRDMEQIHDTSRPPDRIRQDVTRSPGGDSSIFLNNCIGCHSGMDPLAQAFAFYDFDAAQGRLVYTQGQVQPKYLINSDNFKPGFITPDDNWENRFRMPGLNALIGWSPSLPGKGAGAKSFGQEFAYSDAFTQCQVEKVFRTLCFRPPSDAADRAQLATTVNAFRAAGYNLKTVFAQTAVYCAGP
jgi:hypothetical protein